MTQDVENPAIPGNPVFIGSSYFTWGWVVIGALTAAVYYRVLGKLVTDWYRIPDFSHGFLVPIFAVYLVWEKRKTLVETRIAPTWNGIAVVALGLAVLLLGVFGAELFLARVSLIIVLAGLVLSFGGWQLLRELRFPVLVLLLAIPIQAIIFNQITFPLQLLASRLATSWLELVQVPVLRDGNILNLSNYSLEVVEACSGIRSLLTLLSLTVAYTYFAEPRWWARYTLLVLIIPIAIVTNAIRIVGAGLLARHFGPATAEGFLHEFSGWVIFLSALALILICHWGLRRIRLGHNPAHA